MAIEDNLLSRKARAEVVRRPINSAMIDVRVSRGVVHVSGRMATLPGQPDVNLRQEMEILNKTLRSIKDVKDVIWEMALPKDVRDKHGRKI